MNSKRPWKLFIAIILLTIVATALSLPNNQRIQLILFNRDLSFTVSAPTISFSFFGRQIHKEFKLKQGLDILGGTQVVLEADVSNIATEDKDRALESVKEVIARRIDLYGVSEPTILTSKVGENYRVIVELPGIEQPDQALSLLGTTAQLDFRLEQQATAAASMSNATNSAEFIGALQNFQPTGLTGKQLKRATVQFDNNDNAPVVALEFDSEGTDLFAEITQKNTEKVMGIFIDGYPLMLPKISTPILDGKAIITGGFQLEEAKQLAIQLNSGALPVPITILEQRQLGASLGQDSVAASMRAGLVGLCVVVIFMILMYGSKGFLASLALAVYAVITIALYKIIGVTITLPGIAGLILSIGMAVDANILTFERMKEELRAGVPFQAALELGFGRAWDSIKDANIATIVTALILINPFSFSFLNTSGLVRGFGITLLLGVLISLFTGVVVTRTLLRLFLAPNSQERKLGEQKAGSR